MQYNEDGKIEVDGIVFNKNYWRKVPEPENPLGGLTYIKKKDDLAKRFRRFFMDYRYTKLDLEKSHGYNNLSHEEQTKLSTDFLIGLGFVSKDISRYPYYSWTHKLKLEDLKDLFVQTFSNDLKEEIEKYNKATAEYSEYLEDMKNRRIFSQRIEEYISFKSAFTNRKTAMSKLIESIELSIGQGNYRSLASNCEGYGDYSFIPEECKINSFEAMDYAKEWLRTFEPVIDELNHLDGVLNFPYLLQGYYDKINDKVLAEIHVSDLVSFRYQDFLTFLMDFKQRFEYRNITQWKDSEILTGWVFNQYDHLGEYYRGGEGSKWNVFNCDKDYYHSRYGTWGEWLNNKALNGEIGALSDPQTLMDIVNRTNAKRHRHNEKFGLYKKPTILVLKKEAE